MAHITAKQGDIIQFLRKRDYKFVRALGRGGCGETVLLYDEYIDQHFVCKKYAPFSEAHRQQLFAGFVKEVKLLHQLHHRNVVRVFNYYLYPETLRGYLLMEYVGGMDIQGYLSKYPEKLNDLFLQTIAGFSYLEKTGILHRDIRPGNVMVCDDGTVKIIDLGFGKKVRVSNDFAKSISLNWLYEPPAEFGEGRYDFKSEVYFVGKLFETLIRDLQSGQFKYTSILARMCQRNPSARLASFFEVEQRVGTNHFAEIDFVEWETLAHRNFAEAIAAQITRVEAGAKYNVDARKIGSRLNDLYLTFMLEKEVPDCTLVLRSLVEGEFYYRKQGLSVDCVKGFVQLLRSCGEEKGRVVLSNLYTRLDVLPRYNKEAELPDDDIPF